jgi:hypothetical protein
LLRPGSVEVLGGGLMAWAQAGLPVESATEPATAEHPDALNHPSTEGGRMSLELGAEAPDFEDSTQFPYIRVVPQPSGSQR